MKSIFKIISAACTLMAVVLMGLGLIGCDNPTSPSPDLYSVSGIAISRIKAYGSTVPVKAYAGDGDIWVAWEGTAPARDYTVSYNGTTAAVDIESPRAGIKTALISGLTNGTEYSVQVTGGSGSYPAVKATPKAAAQITTGSFTINTGGIYKLPTAPDTNTTVVTVNTGDAVTLIGSGIGNDTDPAYDEKGNHALDGYGIHYTVPGAQLILRDVYIYSEKASGNVIEFTGTDNRLTITGRNLLEDAMGMALVYVGSSTDLTIDGWGTLYMYKTSGSAGIGGNNSASGTITFDGITFFGKTSHPAALIGGSAGYTNGGPITFVSGEYTMEANARGPCIGPGSWDDAQDMVGEVNIKGGTFNFNIDFSGPAIGTSNTNPTSKQGYVHFSGGSIRTFIDPNAVPSWGVEAAGVNDAPIKASKRDAGENSTYLLVFDTTNVADADFYTVLLDGNPFYSGGKHIYRYGREGGGTFSPTNTLANWTVKQPDDPDYENNLYFYLTGKNHTLTVNGQTFNVIWDGESSTFSYQ